MTDHTTERRPRTFGGVVESVAQLRTLYRRPMKEVAEKKQDHLPPWIRVTIEASRFAFLATAGPDGSVTVSPRGGTDGFVAVLDERHLALPDYPGNNLTDSLTNIVVNPHVGLIFVIPGRNETIRVDGDAWVTTDPDVLAACEAVGGRTPEDGHRRRGPRDVLPLPGVVPTGRPVERRRRGVPTPALDYGDFVRDALDPAEWPAWAQPGATD